MMYGSYIAIVARPRGRCAGLSTAHVVGADLSARAFYEGLFGWRFETGPSGEGFTIGAGPVPGGMHGGDRGAAPYLFFRVDDIEAALERVRELGGVVEEMDVDGGQES